MFTQQLENDAPKSEAEALSREETNKETSEKVADPPVDTRDVTEVIDEVQVKASAFAEIVNEH